MQLNKIRRREFITLLGGAAVAWPLAAHAQPPPLDEPCFVSADPRWTQQEKFVWERLCVNGDADFNKADGYGGRLDPKKPDGWPQNRVLRPAFLEMILFKDPYRRALTRGGVVIAGARFTEAIDLENAELKHPFGLPNSLLEKDVNLKRVRSKFPIDLSGSKVSGRLQMDGLRVGGDLSMTDKAEFVDVELFGAHVEGLLDLGGSKVTGKLSMNGLQVGSHLLMSDKAQFAHVELLSARVGGMLDLRSSKVSGLLKMGGLQVGSDLLMSDKAQFAHVGLISARVGGALRLRGSKVSGLLQMGGLQVGDWVDMSDGAEFAAVELTSARVGGALRLRGSKVSGLLNMPLLRVDQDLSMGTAEFSGVQLTGTQVGGAFILGDSKVAGNVICHGLEVEKQVFMGGAQFDGQIQCPVAKFKTDLELTGVQFKKNVDLSGAEIGGELRLDSAQWSDGITLILRNAKAGIIPALGDAWAPKLDLEGFTYRRAGAADQFQDWFRRLDHYAPQPYDQLASVVQSQGNGSLATAIRYSGRERERSEATGGAWAWLTTLKWLIGYGYYPQRAIFWVIGLVMTGAVVLRASGEGPNNGMPFGLAYSFDILLPIIRLRDSHYHIDLKTWARYYFYGHRIMGYVLASFLIAGLTGLTK